MAAKIWLYIFFIEQMVAIITPSTVMSIDLGHEYFKVAVISPKCPMEIVLNEESKRKTPVAIAFHKNQLFLGNDAMKIGLRYPEDQYQFFIDLIGKPFHDQSVKLFQQRFPYHRIEKDPVRGTVLFRNGNSEKFSPEELLAFLLNYSKNMAEKHCDEESEIKDVVISSDIEMNAVKTAVEMSNLNLLSVISSSEAIALTLGISRTDQIVQNVKRNILVYDMGAVKTTVTILQLTSIRMGDNQIVPIARIIHKASDLNLGGLNLQITLRDYLAKKFQSIQETKTPLSSNPKAMMKFFKEAGRVKTVLSANKFEWAQIENVMDDLNFKEKITRDDFLEMNQNFFRKVLRPAKQALFGANMAVNEIHEIILNGGGTRIPDLQSQLKKYFKLDLGKGLNTDESIAIGAAFKAAQMSTHFQTLNLIVTDSSKAEFSSESVSNMSRKELKMSKEKIQIWDNMEAKRLTNSIALNSLETEIINIKINLDEEIYKKFSTSKQRTIILQKCEEISDWLENRLEYNDDENLKNLDLNEIHKKKEQFNSVALGLIFKVKQFHELPEALEILLKIINHAKSLSATKSKGYIKGLEEQIVAYEQFYREALLGSKDIDDQNFPRITTNQIGEKATALEKMLRIPSQNQTQIEDLHEFVPGLIWAKGSNIAFRTMPVVPSKFLQSSHKRPSITFEEVSVVWAAVIISIIHFLFHIFR